MARLVLCHWHCRTKLFRLHFHVLLSLFSFALGDAYSFLLFLSSHTVYLACMQAHHAGLPFGELPRCKQFINDIDARKSFGKSSLLYLSLPSSGFKFMKLKWRKFNHLASDVGGARSIFCRLFGEHKAEDTFWLDSSSTEKVSECSVFPLFCRDKYFWDVHLQKIAALWTHYSFDWISILTIISF